MKYLLYLLGATYIVGGIVFYMFITNNPKSEPIKSVVIIVPTKSIISYDENPRGLFEEYKNSGIGAGFIIDSRGTIQTANHVIENSNIEYKILYNNKEYKSEIIAQNKQEDTAVLKIITENNEIFPYLKLEINSDRKNVGDNIISYGVDINTLEIITNTGTILNNKSSLGEHNNLIEISNKLKPGFSGGPILNKYGKVIGVNHAISEGKNYGINLN